MLDDDIGVSQLDTEPHPAPIFDTAPHPQPLEPEAFAVDVPSLVSLPVSVQSVSMVVRYHYVKWWKLALVVIGVWIPAAAIGLGLYYCWFKDHSQAKVLSVFAVLVYVVTCTVVSLLLAMIDGKPLIAALAIAMMSAPFASCMGAAPLYGHYFCTIPVPKRCVMGILPY